MRFPCRSLLLLVSLAMPPAARADLLDTLTLTGDGHTVVWTLPATSSYPDFSLFNFFSETGPATIDGTSGYSLTGDFYIGGLYPQLVLTVPTSVFGASPLDLFGASFVSWTTVPANNPYPYLPYDIVATFEPGVFNLQAGIATPTYPSAYTLTIAAAGSQAPEPPPAALLGSALFALAPWLCRRWRRTRTLQAAPRACGWAAGCHLALAKQRLTKQ